MNRCSVLIVLGAVALVMVGCGGSGSEAIDPIEVAESETATGPPTVRIEVSGTAEEPPRDGFAKIEPNCEEWIEMPAVGPLAIQVPENWEVSKASSGPRQGEVGFSAGDVHRTIEVKMWEQQAGRTPRDMVGADAEAVGAVDWAGKRVTVFLTPSAYMAYFPAITIDSLPDIYAAVSLGGRGRGDLSNLDTETVLAILETAHLDRCVADSYAKVYGNAEVVFSEDS